MKLEKEEIQKIVLGGMMLAVLLYSYFFVFLAGLNTSEKGAATQLAEIQPKLDKAASDFAALEGLKVRVPEATQTMDAVGAMIPEGAPMAWFPPRIAEFMKRHGIDRCTTRLTNELPDPDMPGYKRLVWSVELPKVEFIPFSIALAGLDNEEPLLEIANIQVEANRDNPQFQRVLMTVSNIVRQ
jgi:hypothetical protein